MNKKIWMTGALSIIAIFATVTIYNNFIMDKPEETALEAVDEAPEAVQTAASSLVSESSGSERLIEYSNGVMDAVFSTEGEGWFH